MLNDFVGKSVDISHVRGHLEKNWWWLLIAVISIIACFVSRSWVHAVMMTVFTGKPRFRQSLAVTTIGHFYDNVLPLGTGSQPFQIHYLQDKNLPKGAAITMPVMEFVLARTVFVVISVVAIIMYSLNLFGNNIILNTGILIISVVGITLNLALPSLLLISLVSKRGCRKVTRWVVILAKLFKLTKDPVKLYKSIMSSLNANIECMKMIGKNKRMLLCILFSFGQNLAHASIAYFVIKAFGYVGAGEAYGFGWVEIVIISILIKNSVAIIPTPGNSGAADLSFYWVFESAIPSSGALATLFWRIISYYGPIVCGLILTVTIATRKRRSKNERQEV